MSLPAIQASSEVAYLADSRTGELIGLDAPTDQLAAWLDGVRTLEQELRTYKRAASDELHRRMDAEARWTVDAGDFKVVGESPNRIEYDGDKLWDALGELEEHGHISARAAHEAVEMVRVVKPKVRGLNALLKLGGVVADRVRECQVPVERDRRISVKIRRPS